MTGVHPRPRVTQRTACVLLLLSVESWEAKNWLWELSPRQSCQLDSPAIVFFNTFQKFKIVLKTYSSPPNHYFFWQLETPTPETRSGKWKKFFASSREVTTANSEHRFRFCSIVRERRPVLIPWSINGSKLSKTCLHPESPLLSID